MTLGGLALRNLARNKLRTALTAFGVAVAVAGFLLLRTFLWAWVASSRSAPVDRVVTRNKVTLTMPLPRRYVDQVSKMAHVKATTWISGFGGKDPRHPDALFGAVAVDQATFFLVYTEMNVAPDHLRAFETDRRGAIVGDAIARRLGWAVGDEVVLESPLYPGDWPFKIDGIYTATAKSANGSNFIARWDYFNDALSPHRFDKDSVGVIVSRADDPARSAEVAMAIDRAFEEGEVQTVSQDERSVSATFLAMYSSVLDAANLVSGVILVVMMLVLGNTMAMAVRERAPEYGVLRAIGFRPGHVALWIVGESVATGVVGGVVGAGATWPLVEFLVRPFVEDRVGAFFPYFRLEAREVLLGLGSAAVLGAVAASIPAWSASRLRVVDAVRYVA